MWRLVLFVWFLTFPLFALCNPAVEKSFRDRRQEDLARNIQEYEVIVPQLVTNTGSILRNESKDAIGNERLYIRFRAF